MYRVRYLIKRNYYGIIWGLSIAAIVSVLYATGVFKGLERLLYDWRITHNVFNIRPDVPKIAIIGISDRDMELMGRWPWPRKRYAELLYYLKEGGASAVAFDMFFDLPDIEHRENDVALSKAAYDSGNVVFPVWSPTANLYRIRPLDGVYKGRLNKNIDVIADSAGRIGHLNVFYDSDGIARRTPIQIAGIDSNEAFMPLSLALFLEQKGIDLKPELDPGHSLKIGELNIPLDSKSCIPINYIDFEHQVNIYRETHVEWIERLSREKPITLYSFYDVAPENKNRVSADKFKGQVVFIGIATPGSEQDVHVTPFGRKFGIFIQANLLYNFLADRLITITKPVYTISIVSVLSIIFGILTFRLHIRGGVYLLLAGGLLLLFIILAIIFFAGLILFQRLNIMIDMIPFLVMSFIYIGSCLAVNLSSAGRESSMRNLELNLLLEVGEITTAKNESDHSPVSFFQDDTKITSALSIPSRPPVDFLEPIKRITHCEATSLYILDDAACNYTYTDFSGLDEIKADAQRIAVPVNKWIQSDTKPVWIEDVSIHPDLSLMGNSGVRSLLAVPLIVRKQTIGILHFYNKRASKMSPFPEFTSEELRLISSFTHQISVAIENHRLNTDIHNIFLDYIKSIAAALDARDAYTHGHSRRVAEISMGIGRELGLSEGELEFLELSATIHDIGKIGINESVLNKPGILTAEEFEIIRSHVIKGSKILEPMSRLNVLMPGVRHHHERYDGKGYPDGLKGEEIHLVARIISVADTFDAMTSDRIYRKGMSTEIALGKIEKEAGTQLDPKLVMTFLSLMRENSEMAVMTTETGQDNNPAAEMSQDGRRGVTTDQ